MSQNTCTIYFNLNDEVELSDLLGEVVNVYTERDVSIFNHFSGELEPGEVGAREYFIEFDSQDPDEALLEALKVIDKPNSGNQVPPVVAIYRDQAGVNSYYALLEGRLAEVDSLDAVDEYLARDISSAPETRFYEQVEALDLFMLVKVEFEDQESMSKLQALCLSFIDGEIKGDVNTFVAHASEIKSYGHYFSFAGLDRQTKIDAVRIVESLCFCEAEGNCLYLGYTHELLKNSCLQVIMEWSAAMHAVLPLANIHGVVHDSVYAKIINKDEEWHIYYLDDTEFFCFEKNKTPAALWA